MRNSRMRVTLLLSLLVCLGGTAAVDAAPGEIEVTLTCSPDGWYNYANECRPETIYIPDDRPIYALLVSGFHQNRNLDMFHWFDFAKYLQERGAYVHFAWWNNLLAPYMEKPLHYTGSVPSTGPIPAHDSGLFRFGDTTSTEDWDDPLPYPTKAIPADDHQFQKDAKALLLAIRASNPTAKIILVGHSMGGGAVVRLADSMPDDFEIDLLAPIDPVGNRTCVENWPGAGINAWTSTCNGLFNFTRWRAIRTDVMDGGFDLFDPLNLLPWYPRKRAFGSNVKYLYHRWQQESTPPFDFTCPAGHEGENLVGWICGSLYFLESEYLFAHPDTRVPGINQGSVNVQSIINTGFDSGKDVPVPLGNFGGTFDGHGEVVGFRGFLIGGAFLTFDEWFDYIRVDLSRLLGFESYPLALLAEGGWPKWQEDDPDRESKAQARKEILEAWEKDPFHLYKKGHEPWNPGLCMVSKDLSNILDTILPVEPENPAPRADSGLDQTVPADGSCIGNVTLDGSGSYDPEGEALTYTWTWNHGADQAEEPSPSVELALGIHEITLVVNDGESDSAPDTVTITVVDDTPPVIELNGESHVVLECIVDVWEEPGAYAMDNCDPNVPVVIGGDAVDTAVPGIYLVAYDAQDAFGNEALAIREVEVIDYFRLFSTDSRGLSSGQMLEHFVPYRTTKCVGVTISLADIPVLSSSLGLDALDLSFDGKLYFSTVNDGFVNQDGSGLRIRQNNIYVYDSTDGVIREALVLRDTATEVSTLDALDRLADGSFAFSTSRRQGVSHAGGFMTLEHQNVYRFDPVGQTLELIFDGKARGISSLDALDILPGGDVAFSTSTDQFYEGIVLRRGSLYRHSATGSQVELMMGNAAGGSLGLDAVTLEEGSE